ncbi:MAG: hypothetical protein ABIQ93_05100 [Saprospiraceae bacterium]
MMKEHIAELLEKSEEELFFELGEALPKPLGARAPSRKKLIRDAKKWLASNNEKLKKLVCKSSGIKTILEKKTESRIEIILLIFELLTPEFRLPVAMIIATLLVRQGIESFCQE